MVPRAKHLLIVVGLCLLGIAVVSFRRARERRATCQRLHQSWEWTVKTIDTYDGGIARLREKAVRCHRDESAALERLQDPDLPKLEAAAIKERAEVARACATGAVEALAKIEPDMERFRRSEPDARALRDAACK